MAFRKPPFKREPSIPENAGEHLALQKLDNDTKTAAAGMSLPEARFLVKFYYDTQRFRIHISNQIKAIHKPYNDWMKLCERLKKEIEDCNINLEFLKTPIETMNIEELKKVLFGENDKKHKDEILDIYVDRDKVEKLIADKVAELSEKLDKATEELAEKEPNPPKVENHETLDYFLQHYKKMENNIAICLEKFIENQPIYQYWLKYVVGIGPIITAGLIAHINIKKANTAGAIERFGGIDPTVHWNKKEKRPWNAELKTLFWKIGQSFIKTSGRPNDFYGKIYLDRKKKEMERNESGKYKELAQEIARTKEFKTDAGKKMKKIYESGKLPQSHILSRAARYATKIFVSHLFSVWYELDRGEKPPKPFAIEHLGHVHEIKVPYWDEEWEEQWDVMQIAKQNQDE